ncbi:hypothetical protein [Methylorubrum extorquens]|uniref:Uncharacterized protein n=1 Tax=Methylorubrum extorquens (strain CM4 / NCIMB 13688) TaxID=440085 RepID=B7KWL3_METC4|nr:hypothetical protein [Methylorubrum extorquens]ACK86090.1 hypothetical protein Mchl_5329 [Methylorubrum extorquens CM4]
MQLSNTASSSDARQHFTPKIFSGWALDRAIIIDCACPGLLASTLYFGPARRQAVFLALASFDWLGQAEIARRFHRAIEGTDALGQSDAAVIGRAILLLRRPRDLVRALFGSIPGGLVGTMQRLGHDPVGGPETYQELQRLFFSSAPADRRQVKVLGQMAGSLLGAQIEIVSLLDPVLLHPTFVSNVYETKQVAELNAALAYVRARCSGATDDAVGSSLSRLKPGDHRSTLYKWWIHRFDRLPRTLDTKGDPTLVILGSAEALSDAGRRYANCLKSKVGEVYVGNYVYIEYRPAAPEPGAIAELRVTTQGFLLEGLYARKNCKVRPERAATVRRKLAACGVALYDHAPDDRDLVAAAAQVLNQYNFAEPDNTGWGVEFDEPPANDLEELVTVASEAA